jgi:hypothetical protein
MNWLQDDLDSRILPADPPPQFSRVINPHALVYNIIFYFFKMLTS